MKLINWQHMLYTFDTHAIVKRFIEGGFKEKQAELIVNTLAESRDYDLSNLTTKSDLRGLHFLSILSLN